MKIKKLLISDIGHFEEDYVLSLQQGNLGLIHGPNEAGKSTLVAALFGVLYGFSAAERKRWRPWDRRLLGRINLEFEHGGKSYNMNRNFRSNHVRFQREGNDEKTIYSDYHKPTPKYHSLYLKAIQQEVPLPAKEILKATSIIYAHQLEVTGNSGLRQMITGANENDYEVILQELEHRYYAITKERLPWLKQGGPRSNQVLENLQKKIESLEKDLDEVSSYIYNQKQYQNKLVGKENEIHSVTKRSSLLQQLREALRQYREIEQKKDLIFEKKGAVNRELNQIGQIGSRMEQVKRTLEQQLSPFLIYPAADLQKDLLKFLPLQKQADDLRKRIEELEQWLELRMQELQQFTNFSEVPDDFLMMLESYPDKEQEIKDLREDCNNLEEQHRTLSRKKIAWGLPGILMLGIAIAAAWAGWQGIVPFIPGIAVSLFLLVVSLILLGKWRQVVRNGREVNEELLSCRFKENTIAAHLSKNGAVLGPFLDQSVEEVRRKFTDYQKLSGEISHQQILLNARKEELAAIMENDEFQTIGNHYSSILSSIPEEIIAEKVHLYSRLRQEEESCLSQLENLDDPDELRRRKEEYLQEAATMDYQRDQLLKALPQIRKLVIGRSSESILSKVEEQYS
ncbi:MAG: AAA family ATPase, partial [Calditrichia bacterium]